MQENMKRLYDDNGNWTEEGRKLLNEVEPSLDALIAKHKDEYNRIEFEHLVINTVSFCFAMASIEHNKQY